MKSEDTGSGPKHRRQRGRQRDPARVARVVAAAQRHFMTHGFDRTSVDAIALDSGVSKMTIYSYFPSKESLFEAAIAARSETVFGALPDEMLDPLHPEPALRAIGAAFLALIRAPDVVQQFRTMYACAMTQPEACKTFFAQGPERLISALARYLDAAHAAGTLHVPQPRLAANLFLAMLMGESHIRLMLGLPVPRALGKGAVLDEALRMLLSACSVPVGNRGGR